MQRSRGQQTTDRDLAVGHIQMQFVSAPSLFAAVAIGLAADGAVPRQLGQHGGQRHDHLPLDARLFTRFLAPAPGARRFRPRGLLAALFRRFGWFYRPLAHRDRRRIPADMPDQPFRLRFGDQRRVDLLRQLRLGKIGESAREHRFVGNLPNIFPTADPAQCGIRPQMISQRTRGPEIAHRLGHERPGDGAPVPLRSPHPPPAAWNPPVDLQQAQHLHQLLVLLRQWPQFFFQAGKQPILQNASVLRQRLQ